MGGVNSPSVEFAIMSILMAWIPALVGALAMSSSRTRKQYNTTNQAPWAPPAWVFGPAWALLYTCMGFAYWILRDQQHSWTDSIAASIVYYVLLVSLAPWTWWFFRWQLYHVALLNIVLCTCLSITVCVLFWLENFIAGILVTPLPIWLLFASSLNLYVVVANNDQ